MTSRYAISPAEAKHFETTSLRENFLMQNLMQPDAINLVYTHYDRMIVGGAVPVNKGLELQTEPALRSDYFLERREMGIINVGGPGKVVTEKAEYNLSKLDCVYLSKGTKQVQFISVNQSEPAVFYLLSSPAHHEYESRKLPKEQATPTTMGGTDTANERTIYKYIYLNGIESCQLVMGLTVLKNGSVWNTMPAHVHDRRMEAYFYFDIKEGHRVFHLMGEPQESRNLVIANHEAVISPPWSIHAGCGTASYSFIWGMAGENKDYSDMDGVAITDLY